MIEPMTSPDHTPTAALALALSVDAAARALSLSPRTVRKLIASGELPATRIRRRVIISIDDLRRLIATA
jgi:excisionase family DNA binding protein